VPRVGGIVFSEADHIIDNIYLGPEGSAIDLLYLRAIKVSRVVVAAKQCQKHFEVYGIKYLYLPIEDKEEEDIA